VRFEEGSASRHWQSSHVAYGALKQVLKRASEAPAGHVIGRSNYGPLGRGLLDLELQRRPGDAFLERGLEADDRKSLESLRSRLLAQTTEDEDLSDEEANASDEDLEVASLTASLTPTGLSKKLWIRALQRETKARAFFLHGFDCALAAEVATAERRYDREAASLERRWTAIAPSCSCEDGAAPEPLKLQLAALDSEARALVDFVVWNLCAVEKIAKKRDKLFPEEPPIRLRVVGILRARDAWTAPRARALTGELRDACAALTGAKELGTAAAVSELRRLGTARGGEAPPDDVVRRQTFEDLGRSASFDETRAPSPPEPAEIKRRHDRARTQPVASVGCACFGKPRVKGVGLAPPKDGGERLVFLDVDGVLHAVAARDDQTLHVQCCDALETIVRATDARLILTGAWRLYPALVERVEALLKKRGLKPLLGGAPAIPGHNREREVRAWFKAHRPKKDPRRRWIALDSGRLDGLRGHLVRTDGEKGLTPLDATIATGLLRGDAGAFLLGCRPDKPCAFCNPRLGLSTTASKMASILNRAPPSDATTSQATEVRVSSPGSLRRFLSDAKSVASDASRTTIASSSWLCPSASAQTLTLVAFDDDEKIDEVVKAADLAALCVDPQRRAAAGLTSLGRGAYADVVCFNAAAPVECEGLEDKVPARRLAVKVGAWPSEKQFNRECDCQQAASLATTAPAVRARAWAGGAAGVGAIVMDRLTCPSFHVWLMWVSRDFSRRPGFKTKERWLVDPRVHRLPLVKAWAAEARRVRKALNDAGIRHGDVHDANVVFDVANCADKVFRGGIAQGKRLKRLLMREIGKGPALSSARLVVVDFGRAKKTTNGLYRFLLKACGDDHRIVDPEDCERASDVTDMDACVSDLESEAYIGRVPGALRGGLSSVKASMDAIKGAVSSPRPPPKRLFK